MENLDPTAVDSTAVYLAGCIGPHGTQIMICADGSVETMESSLTMQPDDDDRLLYGTASGEFSLYDWGIVFDDERGDYRVEDAEGKVEGGNYPTSTEALAASVAIFGLPAECHDQIVANVRERLAETVAEAAAMANILAEHTSEIDARDDPSFPWQQIFAAFSRSEGQAEPADQGF